MSIFASIFSIEDERGGGDGRSRLYACGVSFRLTRTRVLVALALASLLALAGGLGAALGALGE